MLTSGGRPVLFTPVESPSCAGPQAAWFFSEDPADIEAAKSVCAPCGSRPSCLAGALERREPWGVWGGELFHWGVVIPRRRPPGRPRKPHPTIGDHRAVHQREQSAHLR